MTARRQLPAVPLVSPAQRLRVQLAQAQEFRDSHAEAIERLDVVIARLEAAVLEAERRPS